MFSRGGLLGNPIFKIISACFIGGVWGYFALMSTGNIELATVVLILFSGLYCIYYVISDLDFKVYANVTKKRADYKNLQELYKDVVELENYYMILFKLTFGSAFGKKLSEVNEMKRSIKKILDKEGHKR